jgi:hypothetical protein
MSTGVAHAVDGPACTVGVTGTPAGTVGEFGYAEGASVTMTCTGIQAGAPEVNATSPAVITTGFYGVAACWNNGGTLSASSWSWTQSAATPIGAGDDLCKLTYQADPFPAAGTTIDFTAGDWNNGNVGAATWSGPGEAEEASDGEVAAAAVTGAGGDLKDTVVAIGTTALPFGAGVAGLTAAWLYVRRFIRG